MSGNRSKRIGTALLIVVVLALATVLVLGQRERILSHLDGRPFRQDFEDQSAFIEASIRYHIGQWLKANPGRPAELYEAHPPTRRKGGQWAGYAGPGLISGHYIEVIVDDSGSLLKINEMHSQL